MKRNYISSLGALGLIFHSFQLTAQSFKTTDYEKVLWMTTRYYGGQRSGNNNWLVYNHLPTGVDPSLTGKCFINDKDGTVDLSGGWHDAGDHVKFGQTQFYSAYVLLKAYAEFPTGFGDFYSYDYKGYKAANNWTYEGKAHDPNGIPDIIDEVKHATDFFIKCTPDASTFYYQVGQGTPDHSQWITAVKMQTNTVALGGETRVSYKNPADASMPGFCGATLALMARLYKQYSPSYADSCLTHAKYAYAYAKAHPGTVGSPDGSFYGANSHWEDEYVDLCAELYWATGTESYKTEALTYVSNTNKDPNIYYTFDYSNNGELAWYNLSLLGQTSFTTKFNNHINTDFIGKVDGNGLYSGGGTWGVLRYNANAAFMAALSTKLGNTNANINKFIYANIDYIMGSNSQSQSFIVGFGAKSPQHPHQRNVYLNDDNVSNANQQTLVIPTKNQQHGLLVGGVRSGTYSDQITTYQTSEGGIDYNACLVGTLGYIKSILFPTVPPVVNGIEEDNLSNGIVVYPNPSSETFYVRTTGNLSAKVYDEVGRFVSEFNTNDASSFGGHLHSGLYHVLFFDNSKLIKTVNVIKK
jgi:hypothetical protein